MANKCPNCGKNLKATATYCGKCGAKITEEKAPSPYDLPAMLKAKKNILIALGAVLLAAILVLIIINPANSAKAVFNDYLDCLHHQNEKKYLEISYEANFSKINTPEQVAQTYNERFTGADSEKYNSNDDADLLKGKTVRIIEVKKMTDSEINNRRNELSQNYENTARITDIKQFTLEITDKDHPRIYDEDTDETVAPENKPMIGYAEVICVTGKWYIGDVTGLL